MAQDKKQHPKTEPFDGIKDQARKPPSYFNILYYGLIIWGLIFMAYYLLSGWSSQGEFQEKMAAHQERISAGTATDR